MNRNSAHNALASDTTLPSEPRTGPRDEGDLIALKGRVAEAAAKQTATELLRALGRVLNPLGWTRRYPVAGTATAAAAGFIVSVGVFPGGKARPQEPGEASESPREEDKSSGLWSYLLSTGVGIARDALVPVLREALLTKINNPHPPSSKNSPEA